MKYKIGDRVRIKSLDWYNENKDEYGYIDCGSREFSTKMSDLCGKIATIKEICKTNCYHLEEYRFDWTDKMIEGKVEEEVFIKANDIYNEEYSKGEYCHEQSFKWGFQEGYNYSHEKDKLEILVKESYQFVDENNNVINATKIVLEKKKKEYPKTYEDCSLINGAEGRISLSIIGKFTKLINTRNAYWRIAGKEMGLGKSWEPDWTNQELLKYCIANVGGKIKTSERYIVNTILAFPTEEMRDTFYENFKSEIEECKEFL